MAFLIPLREVHTHEDITAASHNEIVKRLNAITPRPSEDLLVETFPSGTKQKFRRSSVLGGGRAFALFAVNVLQTGGGAGDANTFCTFTYAVTDLNGKALGAAKAPLFSAARIIKCTCTAGTHGTAYYDQTNALQLAHVDEIEQQFNCAA